jgi:hypothetical protein
LAIAMTAIGCHPAKPAAPAWPAPSTTADDGGESIAPASNTVAAVEQSEDNEVETTEVPEILPKPGAPAAEPETPAVDSPDSQPTTDGVIMSEELIIEIDD